MRQTPLRLVLDLFQVKPLRSESRRGQRAGSRQQNVRGPLRRVLSLPHVNQRTDDIAHHVMQECVRPQDEVYALAAPTFGPEGLYLEKIEYEPRWGLPG